MADRNRSHIVVQGRVTAEDYTRRAQGGGGDEVTPPADRAGHARRLIAALERAESAGHRRRQAASATVEGAIPGIYVTFESFPGMPLALASLDPLQGKVHAELRSVQERPTAAGAVQVATVFVPDGKLGSFVRKLEKYTSTAAEEKPRNRTLADPVSEIALASIRALWTDLPADFPAIGPRAWWEVWLRRRDGNEPARFTQFAEAAGCQVGPNRLSFKDRTVILVQATVEQLAGAVDVLDDLAELRRPHQPEAVLALDSAADQAEWVRELSERLEAADGNAPAVCVLDTGVHQAHPLLSSALDAADQHTCNPRWGLADRAGHGTEMAGLALFGDLGRVMLSTGQVRPPHRLESVKLLPASRMSSWRAATWHAPPTATTTTPPRSSSS